MMIEKASTIVRTMTTAMTMTMRTWVDDSGGNGYHGEDFDQHKNGDVHYDVDFAHHGVNGEVPDFDCNHHDFEFRGPET